MPSSTSAAADRLSALADQAEWVIEPRAAGFRARAVEVWRYRRLLRFFATRSLEKRYRNTVLGPAWLFIRPLFPLLVKTFVFGGMLGVASEGVPYFLFLLVGNSAWDLFNGGLLWATRSLELNRGFLDRVYVPRVILPLATMSPVFVNLGISAGVFAVGAAYYYVHEGTAHLAPPVLWPWALLALLLILAFTLALGFFTSVFGAGGRDVRFTLGYIMDFWSLATPVLYPLSAMPEKWRWIVYVNPMAPFVQMFKYGVLGVEGIDAGPLISASIVTAVLFCGGLYFFAHAEAGAVDRI